MILYPLECLVSIRARREESAAGVLSVARHDMEDATSELDVVRHELLDFRAGKEERLGRVFATIEGKRVSMPEIDLVREALSNIEAEGVVKEDKVVQAEVRLAKCECAVKDAHNAFADAVKSHRKIDEHRVEWAKERARKEERLEESEIEDIFRPHLLLLPSFAIVEKVVSSPSCHGIEIFSTVASEVADAILASSELVRGVGRIDVHLKGDVLDGSTIRLEFREKTLQVVVEAATSDVRMLVDANRCAFEQYLGERINTWRISVALAERRGYDRK